MRQHGIAVSVEHVCDPTETKVNANDIVIWNGDPSLEITFPNPPGSPFTTPGPFPSWDRGDCKTARRATPKRIRFRDQHKRSRPAHARAHHSHGTLKLSSGEFSARIR